MASLDSMALPVPEQSGDIVWAQLPTAANAPSARSGHSFTIVPASRQVRRISAAESDELLLLYAGDHASLGIPINTGCGLCGKSFGVTGGFRAIFVASVLGHTVRIGWGRFKHPGGERRLFACETGLYVWGLRRESKPRYFLQRFARPQNLRGLRLGHGACAPR